MRRITRGDVIEICGANYVALWRERGRAGEDASMWAVGRSIDSGVAVALEMRSSRSLARRPRVGKVVVSMCDAGGYYYYAPMCDAGGYYYYAPRWGSCPSEVARG